MSARAAAVVLRYDELATRVKALTDEISATRCPREGDPALPFDTGESCFSEAKRRARPETLGRPEDGERPIRLAEVAIEVRDCPSCSRLCEAIAERRDARRQLGVAKRALRTTARAIRAEASR